MKKYTYQAKTFEEAKNQAMSDLMEQEENLYIKEIESTNKLFNKKSVIEVIKKEPCGSFLFVTIRSGRRYRWHAGRRSLPSTAHRLYSS